MSARPAHARVPADAPGVDAVAVAPARAVRPVPVAGLVVGRADDAAEHAADNTAETALARLRRVGASVGAQRRQPDATPATTVDDGVIRRYFPPPAMALGPFGFTAVVTKTGGKSPNAPVAKQGWSVDKETAPATEIANNGAVLNGVKTTRLTALLTPGHVKLLAGGPTAQGYDPIGWTWIVTNEVRSKKRQRISHWVRFHLLNATLGGKGRKITHLVPADQSANGKWRTGIEAAMKAALVKGPVWYDVQITYYTQAEAPGTYAATPSSPIDYTPNITLFPKTIQGELLTYDPAKQQWQNAFSATVRSGQPAAPGQMETELVGAQNLSQLASVYQIDAEVLALLSHANAPFTTYGQVRRRLENWAANFSGPAQYQARTDRIASSEPYLRSALSGTGNRKLKIHNAFVPDDDTPEAKFYDSPARVKEVGDLWYFDNVTQWIRTGYHWAIQDQHPPSAKQFFHRYIRGPWGKVTLGQLQTEWDAFVAANDALPPLVHTDFAEDGREVLALVVPDLEASVPAALRAEYERRVGPCLAIDSLVDLVKNRIPQFVESNLATLSFMVYGSAQEGVKAVKDDPAVGKWVQEMDFRAQWVAHLESKGLLAQSPYDVLAASVTDMGPVTKAQAWYESTKKQATVPAQQPMPSIQPAFGGFGSPFGGSTTAPPFGGFGGPTPSPTFGGPTPSPIFGQPSPSPLFGGPTPSPTFGQPSSSPLFGGPTPSPTFGGPTTGGPGASQLPKPGQRNPDPRGRGGAIYSSHSQRMGAGKDPYSGTGISGRNLQVIAMIKDACKAERARGRVIDEARVDSVLEQWRKPTYAGRGDVDRDVEKAMDYILRHS